MSRRPWLSATALAIVQLLPQPMAAQSTLSLSGDPQAQAISTAVAGFQPNQVVDEGTTYSVTAGEISAIEVSVDAPLPPGVTLWVQLEPPPGALGSGPVELATFPRVLVSSIPPGTYTALGVRYHLSATVQAGVVPIGIRNITFTVIDSP